MARSTHDPIARFNQAAEAARNCADLQKLYSAETDPEMCTWLRRAAAKLRERVAEAAEAIVADTGSPYREYGSALAKTPPLSSMKW